MLRLDNKFNLWHLLKNFINKLIFKFFPSRIQDSDGGFFERFGSLLHAREENNEEKLLADPASLVHPDIKQRPKDAMPAASDIKFEARSSTAADTDSGNESAESADSDSEEKREENIRKLQNSLVGMNVSDSYLHA